MTFFNVVIYIFLRFWHIPRCSALLCLYSFCTAYEIWCLDALGKLFLRPLEPKS